VATPARIEVNQWTIGAHIEVPCYENPPATTPPSFYLPPSIAAMIIPPGSRVNPTFPSWFSSCVTFQRRLPRSAPPFPDVDDGRAMFLLHFSASLPDELQFAFSLRCVFSPSIYLLRCSCLVYREELRSTFQRIEIAVPPPLLLIFLIESHSSLHTAGTLSVLPYRVFFLFNCLPRGTELVSFYPVRFHFFFQLPLISLTFFYPWTLFSR